jgi:hypothetical protein
MESAEKLAVVRSSVSDSVGVGVSAGGDGSVDGTAGVVDGALGDGTGGMAVGTTGAVPQPAVRASTSEATKVDLVPARRIPQPPFSFNAAVGLELLPISPTLLRAPAIACGTRPGPLYHAVIRIGVTLPRAANDELETPRLPSVPLQVLEVVDQHYAVASSDF